MRRRSWAVCIAIAAAIPFAAAAEEAFTVRAVGVFAGPSSEYPPIAQLPPNTAVDVAGCLSDWSWCDVLFANDRGWVYASDLAVPFQGARVVIIEYGPRIHLPVVTFSLVTYWERYYRARPFYRERQQWVSRVHIDANHGGRAPAGHERTAQQTAPAAQPQQAPTREARPSDRNTQTAKSADRNVQNAKPAAKPADRNAQPADTARAAKEAPQPKEAQRPQLAQSPQPAQQPQPRQQRKAQETRQPQATQPAKDEHQSRQSAKVEPSPKAEGERQAQPPQKTEASPQANRRPEADRRQAAKPQQEEKSNKEG